MAELLTLAVGSVGVGVLANCITSITASANGIYTLVGNISSSTPTPDIHEFLIKSNIVSKVKLLECLVRETDTKSNPTKTLKEAIKSVQNSLAQIEAALNEVKRRIDHNKSLYVFVYFRSYGFTDIIQKLMILKEPLNEQYQDLRGIIAINQYLNPMSESVYVGSTEIFNMN